MNVYVMVDIEGISGIYTKDQVAADGKRFAEGRRYITEEVNVCVKALKDAGVDQIYVYDCHGTSCSVIWEALSGDADYYICGSNGSGRMPGIEHCDGVIFLGYHAMAGTKGAVLEHTYSSKLIQNLYLCGKKIGEIGLDAAIAGEQNKKILMVSGDDKACAEAKSMLPYVVTCEVKKGMGSFGAMLLPKEKAHKRIYEKTLEAIKNAERVKPYKIDEQIVLKVELMERISLPNPLKDSAIDILDGRSYQVTANTVEEAFYKAI